MHAGNVAHFVSLLRFVGGLHKAALSFWVLQFVR